MHNGGSVCALHDLPVTQRDYGTAISAFWAAGPSYTRRPGRQPPLLLSRLKTRGRLPGPRAAGGSRPASRRAIAREITRHDYDVTALVVPGSDPELAGAALAALLAAAAYDGAWHRDWTDPRTAAQGRRTTDQLASVFYRDQHRHDQELPLEP
jgi:hypothetical protein